MALIVVETVPVQVSEHRAVFALVAPDTSYPTGGWTLDPQLFGMTKIHCALDCGAWFAHGSVASGTTFFDLETTPGFPKLILWNHDAITETANGTDLTGLINDIPILVLGS